MDIIIVIGVARHGAGTQRYDSTSPVDKTKRALPMIFASSYILIERE
ncbi:hypothetical protein [Herbaspirillum seropedicae]|nr:hypothetical protein [Herbaspirillum seropedicae]